MCMCIMSAVYIMLQEFITGLTYSVGPEFTTDLASIVLRTEG